MKSSGPAIAVLAGAAATMAAAAAVGMDLADAALLAGTVGAGALAAAVLGAAVLRACRGRSVGLQSSLVAITSVAAVAAGMLVSGWAMFVSGHDVGLLAVATVAGAGVGLAVALSLGHHLGRASQSLGLLARRIGEGAHATADPPGPPMAAPAELAAVAEELQEMAARLDQARTAERAVEASRRELVAWVSHDLRTPLAGIRAIAEALEDGLADDEETVRRYHRALREEADRLSGLVDDLFELSRIQAGALRLQLERASLTDLVSDAMAAAHPVADAKNVRLEGRVAGPTPELVLSTPEVLRVLRNLLDNAIKHTPSDGTVWVEAGIDDGRAYVSVEDACGGIPDTDIDRVFDVAFRGAEARPPGDGAGLGLAIARGIVEAHRGEIVVANQGAGCRFTVRLPLAQT